MFALTIVGEQFVGAQRNSASGYAGGIDVWLGPGANAPPQTSKPNN